MTAEPETPWYKRSRREFALRDAGHTPKRILMQRWADENGLDSDKRPALWKDVATFGSYNDAESIFTILNATCAVKNQFGDSL
jgi:hypothetical protein